MGKIFGITQFSLLLSFCINTILGLWVYLNGRDRKANQAFCLLTLALSGWSFSVFMIYSTNSDSWMLFWGRLSFASSAFIMSSFFYFTLTFPRERQVINRSKLFLIFSPSFLFASLSPSNLLLKRVNASYELGFDAVHGSGHIFFTIYAAAFVLAGLVNLIRNYWISDALIEKLQIRYALIGIGISALIALLTNAVLPAFGSSRFSGIGPALTIIMIGFISYSIVQYQLMDIDFILKKGTTYVFLFLLLAPILLIISSLQKLFFGSTKYLFSLSLFLLMLIPIYIIPKIKPKAEEQVERLIFKGKYDYRNTLKNLSKVLVSILDLKSLTRNVIDAIVNAIGVKKASLFLLDEEKGMFNLHEHRNIKGELLSEGRLSKKMAFSLWLQNKGEIVALRDLTGTRGNRNLDAVRLLKMMEAEICIPLIAKDKLIGLINLGERKNGGIYSTEDIELLSTLATQTGIAIENARLYEDLKKKESIMRRADRLASLGTLTAGLAHEIRNPLVAIKTLTQLLPERLDDEEFRKDFLAIASGEVDRISSLVNELLDFARPTKPQLQLENIQEIMDGMILLISTEVKKKNLEMVTRYEENLPPIAIDREQIKQVFLNILLNAIEATDERGQVSAEIRSFSGKNGERFVQVEIRDTGRGIPEEHLDNIFTPFFTTKKKGSGLGLSNAHQIVQEHGGTISIESRMGKGSSFLINLPVAQEEREGKAPVENKRQASQPLD